MRAEGWYHDPYGIHDDRWISDGHPTDLVRDKGVESRDAPPPEEPRLALVPVAEIEESEGADLLRADVAKVENFNYMDGSGSLGVGFN